MHEAVPTARYRPPLDAEAARILAALRADGGASGAVLETTRLDVPATDDIDVVAVHLADGRYVVGALDTSSVALGIAAAERIYTRRNEAREPPTAVQLARILGATYYFPWRIFDGSSWTETGMHEELPPPAGRPMFVTRPNVAGRVLTFTYAVPFGTPGAGPHMANFHVTDSGYLIDEAPNPTRR